MAREPIIIERDENEIIHTEDHPFCSDLNCPCHNTESYMERVGGPIDAGQMVPADGLRLYFGQVA